MRGKPDYFPTKVAIIEEVRSGYAAADAHCVSRSRPGNGYSWGKLSVLKESIGLL